MNDTIMAEDMKPQETKAFVSKPYSNDERIKKEDFLNGIRSYIRIIQSGAI